jgi:hypothetical protein
MPLIRLTFLLIVWALAFSTSSFAHPPAPPTPDQPPHLQVSLFNDARVDSATLAEAEARASAIFAESGIAVDWLVCAAADPADFSPRRTACSALVWPSHLSVRIRPEATSVSADTFGQAFVDPHGEGLYSNVYFENLARPNRSSLSNGEMLGYVLAHELGHLLLGTNSHSASGIMQPRWDSSTLRAAALSSLVFTRGQSSTLRSRLAANSCKATTQVVIPSAARNLLLPVVADLQIGAFWWHRLQPVRSITVCHPDRSGEPALSEVERGPLFVHCAAPRIVVIPRPFFLWAGNLVLST